MESFAERSFPVSLPPVANRYPIVLEDRIGGHAHRTQYMGGANCSITRYLSVPFNLGLFLVNTLVCLCLYFGKAVWISGQLTETSLKDQRATIADLRRLGIDTKITGFYFNLKLLQEPNEDIHKYVDASQGFSSIDLTALTSPVPKDNTKIA